MSEQNSTTTTGSPVDFDKVDDIKILSGPPSFEQGQPDTAKSNDENEGEEEEDLIDNKAESQEEEEVQDDLQEEQEDQSYQDDDQNDDSLELSEDQVEDLVFQRLGLSASDIEQKLERLDALEKEGTAPKFPSEKHQKLYDFVSKYSGDDFENGILRFSKLQSLDIEKLDPKVAMQELYYQKHPQLNRDKADKLFEYEYNQKYGHIDDEDVAQTLETLDGDKAKKELIDFQKETVAAKTETDNTQQVQLRDQYLKGVDDSLVDFDHISFGFEGDTDSDYNFEIENKDQIKDSMSSIETLLVNTGWMDANGKFDFDKMKVDVAFIFNKEKILESTHTHGKEAGKEIILREIQNKTPKERKPSNPGKVGPQTKEDAMYDAIMNHPKLK